LRLRDRLHLQPATTAVFVSPADTRLLYCNVQATFARLTRQAGLQPPVGIPLTRSRVNKLPLGKVKESCEHEI
jgi:hypothetical protein